MMIAVVISRLHREGIRVMLSLSPLKLSVVSGAVPRFLTADLFSSTRVQFLSDIGTDVGPILQFPKTIITMFNDRHSLIKFHLESPNRS